MALGILENLVKNSSIKYVSLQDIEQYVKEENELLRPPEDKVMLLFLMRAMQGRLSCTKAKASLEMIEPFSVDFCLTYPIQVINRAANEIAKGNSRSILVYWNGKKLMTSDDYAFYLAYRKLGHKEIDVVVLGSMPEGAARVVKKGGAELIPPVAYGPSFGLSSSFVDSKYEELDNRLSGKNIQVNVSELYGIFMVFCEIMQDKNTKERDLHNYILQNPILLDPHIRVISSEVWLGKEYRIDIIAQYNNGKPLLVELERHNLPLFAKSGQPQAPVTHAYQQVEDWLQWWSENQSLIPLEIDKTLPPEGLVVIGRSNKLSNKEKKKLIHLNQNRRVRLLTYDDLLDQLESIIYVLERRIRLTR